MVDVENETVVVADGGRTTSTIRSMTMRLTIGYEVRDKSALVPWQTRLPGTAAEAVPADLTAYTDETADFLGWWRLCCSLPPLDRW